MGSLNHLLEFSMMDFSGAQAGQIGHALEFARRGKVAKTSSAHRLPNILKL